MKTEAVKWHECPRSDNANLTVENPATAPLIFKSQREISLTSYITLLIDLKPEMIRESLSKSTENIIIGLGSEIERNGTNIRQGQSNLGWQYGGKVFENSIQSLKDDMMKSSGYRVLECTAFHFIKPAKIRNPTKRYILIPIEGPSILNPGGPLSKSFTYLFDNEPILEAGEGGVDMICMALEGENGGSSVSRNVGVESVE